MAGADAFEARTAELIRDLREHTRVTATDDVSVTADVADAQSFTRLTRVVVGKQAILISQSSLSEQAIVQMTLAEAAHVSALLAKAVREASRVDG